MSIRALGQAPPARPPPGPTNKSAPTPMRSWPAHGFTHEAPKVRGGESRGIQGGRDPGEAEYCQIFFFFHVHPLINQDLLCLLVGVRRVLAHLPYSSKESGLEDRQTNLRQDSS